MKTERARRRIAARCTAILDTVEFPRVTPVVWSEAEQAFVVIYTNEAGGERVKFLGTGSLMAIEAARRERAKALAPERRRRAAENFQGFMQILGAIVPVLGALIPLVRAGG